MSYKYKYKDNRTRKEHEISASSLILETPNGSKFRLYEHGDAVVLRCDGQMVVYPCSSNKIEVTEE